MLNSNLTTKLILLVLINVNTVNVCKSYVVPMLLHPKKEKCKSASFYYFYGFANGYDLLNWHTGNIKLFYTNCNWKTCSVKVLCMFYIWRITLLLLMVTKWSKACCCYHWSGDYSNWVLALFYHLSPNCQLIPITKIILTSSD